MSERDASIHAGFGADFDLSSAFVSDWLEEKMDFILDFDVDSGVEVDPLPESDIFLL